MELLSEERCGAARLRRMAGGCMPPTRFPMPSVGRRGCSREAAHSRLPPSKAAAFATAVDGVRSLARGAKTTRRLALEDTRSPAGYLRATDTDRDLRPSCPRELLRPRIHPCQQGAPLRCAAPRRRALLTSAHLEPDPAPAREFRLRAHTRATATAAALGSAAGTFCQKAQRKRAQCQGLAHCKARGPD